MERNKFFAAIDFEDETLSRSIFESISEAQLNISDDDERTLLHNAVSKNKQFIVEILISKGADVNKSDENMWSPLHSCSSSGFLELAKLLIASGADCRAKTSSGCTPLHYAASKGHIDIVRLIVEKDRAVIDVQDVYGRSAIFMSACSGRQECFDFLFQEEADLTLREKVTGDTILHAAINGYHEEIAYKIAYKIPDMLMVKNNEGKIPLDLSSKEFTEELFEIIKKNFDPNSIDELLSK